MEITFRGGILSCQGITLNGGHWEGMAHVGACIRFCPCFLSLRDGLCGRMHPLLPMLFKPKGWLMWAHATRQKKRKDCTSQVQLRA
eukprot:1160538-Pelagomonas_calceolata.AAC.5